jgi:hypothetical protein
MEICHSRCLKIDREGQAVSQGSLCDNASGLEQIGGFQRKYTDQARVDPVGEKRL